MAVNRAGGVALVAVTEGHEIGADVTLRVAGLTGLFNELRPAIAEKEAA